MCAAMESVCPRLRTTLPPACRRIAVLKSSASAEGKIMKIAKLTLTLAAAIAVSGCVDDKRDKTVDRFVDSKHLSQLKAGIWVDPNGCDHWIIDDGIEGYLSQRLDKYGKPVCSGVAPPNTAVGPFNKGTPIADPI